MLAHIISRRSFATIATATVAAVGSVAGVSLAQDNTTPPTSTTSSVAGPSANILAGVNQILAGLVKSGTITQQQADAVQAQANAGSIDPKQLVQQDVVTDPQMRTIAARIDQLKQAAD